MKVLLCIRNFLAVVGGIAFVAVGIYLYDFFTPTKVEISKDIFDWSVKGEYSNSDASAIAVLEYGVVNNGAKTAPIYRLILKTPKESEKWGNNWNVWNSHARQIPIIKWVDGSNIEITQTNDKVWEYEPRVTLNNNEISVHINVKSAP